MATVHTRETVTAALDTYLLEHRQLVNKAWLKATGIAGGTVALHLGSDRALTALLCAYAGEHAPPDRVYTWGQCPAGARHQPADYFTGTSREWAAGQCLVCDRRAARYAAWQGSLPTFAAEHPDLVPYLADPADADSRGKLVAFVCTGCGARPLAWSPSRGGIPVCGWCHARDGHAPGELVARRGGGEIVKLETALATALQQHGVECRTDVGVVTERGSYHVPVIKPDLVLPLPRIAIELDHTARSEWSHSTHDQPAGVADDQHRDQLLAALGWRVLRIRRPDQPVDGPWPWRIETTSTSATVLANLVLVALAPPVRSVSGHAPAGSL